MEVRRPSTPPGRVDTTGAVCAMHPQVQAHAVCQRCGNYMCYACSQQGRHSECPSCRQRSGAGAFPFHRQNWTFGGIVNYAIEVWKRQWLALAGAFLIMWGGMFGIGLFFGFAQAVAAVIDPALAVGVNLLGTLVQVCVQTWLQLGFFAFTLKIASGLPPDFSVYMTQLRRTPAAIAQLIVAYLPFAILGGLAGGAVFFFHRFFDTETVLWTVGIAVAILAFPLCYYVLGIVFMQIELVHNMNSGPIEALGTSWRIARGERLAIFGVLLLVLVVSLAGLIACCVGLVFTVGIAQLIFCSLFLSLRAEPTAWTGGMR